MAGPITVLVGALGGQGGGVLAAWLVEAAGHAGYHAQGTSIPGVAQRTGATTYYVEIHPEPIAALGGRRPVLGLYPVPGCVDLIVASELLEAARIVEAGFASPDRTVLVASTSRTLTTQEKMAPGDGRVPSERLLAVLRAHCRRLHAFDMEDLAREAGTLVSAVMCGAIAGAGVLPFGSDALERVIREGGAGAEASLRGFVRALAPMAGGAAAATPAPAPSADAGAASELAGFPADVADVVALGSARLEDFQDRAYAELYRARLAPILAAERAADPERSRRHALARESARFLALWMAFDDVMRVADLKSRASRFARVRHEVAAGDGDLVRIVDYLKPGIAEIAGLLPPALAGPLRAWDRRRQARGREPRAWPLRVRADRVGGFLLLRMLAGLRVVRRHGARYREEQAAIERWLAAVTAAARVDWTLAYEIALCGRLIKGYGATNERGKRNLRHILDHLVGGASFSDPATRAAAVREAREAALADEGGRSLDEALVRHGAPARPAIARPVAFVRRGQAEKVR
jgi:indolepyruvate ferredoxin oxidoreductase beta subunit